MMTILPTFLALGADHRGFEFKNALAAKLKGQGIDVRDMGCNSADSADAFDYAVKVAEELAVNPTGFGVLVCGSGHAMCMTANRFPFIRAAICRTAEEARIAREHNDVNVLCLAADTQSLDEAWPIIEAFLQTPASGEERFLRRRAKLAALDPSAHTPKGAQ